MAEAAGLALAASINSCSKRMTFLSYQTTSCLSISSMAKISAHPLIGR
jgi:hypothetical protein